jgi:hypothetical protein
MTRITGPLRESTHYEPQVKPDRVEVGQVWRVSGMQGRPLCTIAIVQRKGCSTYTWDRVVPWAIFRKGFSAEVESLLTSKRWEYLGTMEGETTNGHL